jgi:hypothetical protein
MQYDMLWFTLHDILYFLGSFLLSGSLLLVGVWRKYFPYDMVT